MFDFIPIINQSIEKMYPDVVRWRRHFHQNPELSFKEHQTTNFIHNNLGQLGYFELERPEETVVIATLKGQ